MKKRKPYNRKRIEEGIRKYAGKMGYREIARILDVTPGTVSKYASEIGISLETDNRKERIVKNKEKRIIASEFFNVKQHQNWLV